MGKIAGEFKLNVEILKRCREQMNLSQDDVKKKIPSIDSIES